MTGQPPSLTPEELLHFAILDAGPGRAEFRGLAAVKRRHPEVSIHRGEFRTWRAVVPLGGTQHREYVHERPGDLLGDLRAFYWDDSG